MDRALLFRLLVVAPEHEPTFLPETDPLQSPVAAVLKPRTAEPPPARTIRGRVVDGQGEPVAQAVVSVSTTVIGNTFYGSPPAGTDPLAVSDDHGEFSLGSTTPFDAMELQIEARTLARGLFADVKPGGPRRDFVLTEGAAITGRVVRDGRPVRDVVIGACGTDRTIGNFTGDFTIASQADGRFLLPNLPPNREYFLYGLMHSLTNHGTLPVRRVKPGGDGVTLDVGDYVATPGRRLAGQVKLSDGKPLPPGTRLVVGREEAWDTLALELPPDGRFEFVNLPAGETLNLHVALKGYRPSPRNASYESLNASGLTGRLEADKTDLVFLLEPGEARPGEWENVPEQERPQNLPLGGIETSRPVKPGLIFTGRAVDADTREPLAGFRVIPGTAFDEQVMWVEWRRSRAVTGTNGVFTVDAGQVEAARLVVLLAEAPGYLPAQSRALKRGETNWTFTLRKGEGPRGVLRDVDGQPLAGVPVFYLGPREQVYLPQNQPICGVPNPERSECKTDAEGRFQFAPKLGGGELFAATQTGFARVPAEVVRSGGEVRIQAWAKVTGRFIRDGRPVANEPVELQFAGGFKPERPYLYLQGTKSGEDGRFTLERVPAGELQLATRHTLPGDGGAWSVVPQKTFTAQPGETLDLGDVEMQVLSGR